MKYDFNLKLLCAALMCGVLLTACEESKTVVEKEVLRPVRYVTVDANADQSMTRVMSGRSKAGQESRLSFKVAGTVDQLAVKVGDKLKKGQLIAHLDSVTYELDVQNAKASLDQANAEARNAKSSYSRTRALYENNNASVSDLDASRAAFESAQARVKSAQKSLQIKRLNLSYTRLTANAGCYVSAVNIEVNENVQSGQNVVNVVCGDESQVVIDVPESMIANVKKGMAVEVTFNAFPEQRFVGQVSEVGISAQGSTTFEVTINLQDRPENFRAGLAADVSFEFETAKNTSSIFVPSVAVSQDEQGTFVYVVETTEQPEASVVRRRAVEVGELTSQGMLIHSGLSGGDNVVTAGISVVYDGLKVKATQ